MANYHEDLTPEAKAGIKQTDSETVRAALASGEDVIIVDVRGFDEYETEHIPQARLLPLDELESRAAEALPDKHARIVTHCAAGRRGSLAAKRLEGMGYTNAANLDGGLNAWKEKGYETE